MDVITLGESMVLFNPESEGHLRYVNSFSKDIAGAESNVAIALSRLGHQTGWFSKLGDDEFGRYINMSIRGEGVDVSRVKLDSERNTGLLFKERYLGDDPNVYYYRKNSAASSLCADDLDEEYIKSAKIIHLTGITPAISESAREMVFKAIDIAKQNGVKVSFDPNIRLKLWKLEEAKEVLLKIAAKSDIVLPGVSEGEMLLGTNVPEEIADKFLKLGCGIVAVKLGKNGCLIANSQEKVYVKGYPIEKVIDSVGAGDGFAAGILSGIIRGLSLKECGELGNGVGAMATLVKGDMEGYPLYSQLMEFIGRVKHIDR